MTEDEFMDKWNPTRQGRIVPDLSQVIDGKVTIEQVWDEMDRLFTAIENGTANLQEIEDLDSDIEQIELKNWLNTK